MLKKIFIGIGAFLLLMILILVLIPSTRNSLSWRFDQAVILVRSLIAPPQDVSFEANQTSDFNLDATLTALESVTSRCETAGIKDYVLDPGIGIWTPFRSVEDDWTLCRHFSEFGKFGRPVLAAISRKTFIGDLLNRDPEDRLAGSLAVTLMLLEKGASVVRTHDVAQTLEVIRVFERMVKHP